MKHWAFHLIGTRWPEAACLTFVRETIRNRIGAEVPDAETLRDSGWRRVPIAMPDDVVMMDGPKGSHVGVWVETASRVGVLHAHGTVQFETLATLKEHGYTGFRFWRFNRA